MGAPLSGSYIRLIYTMHNSHNLRRINRTYRNKYHLQNLNFFVINELNLFSFFTIPKLRKSTTLLVKYSLTPLVLHDMHVWILLASTSIHLDQNCVTRVLSHESVCNALNHHQMTHDENVLLFLYTCTVSTDRLSFYNACCLHKTTSLMNTWYSEFYQHTQPTFSIHFKHLPLPICLLYFQYLFSYIFFLNYSDHFK